MAEIAEQAKRFEEAFIYYKQYSEAKQLNLSLNKHYYFNFLLTLDIVKK